MNASIDAALVSEEGYFLFPVLNIAAGALCLRSFEIYLINK